MSFRVAIVSYKRAEQLSREALALLERHHIQPERITVGINGEWQREEYERILGTRVGRLIVTESLGLAGNRRSLQLAHDDGDPILWLNDDVRDMMRLRGGKLAPVDDLVATVDAAFDECWRFGATLWGGVPLDNDFYMKEAVNVGLNWVPGAMFGEINVRDPRLAVRLEFKEDYERTLRRYRRDGCVVSYRGLAPKTTYYNKDGMAEFRTVEKVAAEVAQLKAWFPGMIRDNPRRKSPFPEVMIVKSKREMLA